MAKGNPNPSPATRFKPGQTLNPGGKPVNARNRVTKKFLEDLAEDFEKNGKAAIVRTREKDPARYVAIVASLLPKEMVIERPLEGISDDELANLIALLREHIGADGGSGEGAGDTPEPKSPKGIRALH